jgi:adenosylhomocysteine nucleosidase
MKRIGIVAALPGEIRPLVRGWKHGHDVFQGRIGEVEAVAACAGMGAAAVTGACESLLAAGKLDALVSIGWAGSLSCGLQAGQAYAVREVIDTASGERFMTDSAKGQRLITLDHVADAKEKRSLGISHQAVMVDMEAATVARLARAKKLGFDCFKAITDGPNDKLPDFNAFTGPTGQLRMPTLIGWALVHPQHWGALRRLGSSSREAAVALSNLVHGFFAGSQ